jgi:drug/metabolite transporter (DMT)-like permease
VETQSAAQPLASTPHVDAGLPRRADYLLLPILSLLWGSSYLWISLLLNVFNTPALLLVRMAIAGVVLGLVLLLRGRRLPPFGRLWLHIVVVAMLADLVPLGLLIWAQSQIPSSTAAIINATTPLFALLAAALVFGSERLSVTRIVGVCLGFLGVVLLSGAGEDGAGSIVSPGVLAALGSSVLYGCGFAYVRRFVRGDPTGIVVSQMFISLIVLLPITALYGTVDMAAARPSTVLAILAQCLLSSGLGYVLYYTAIDRLGPGTASLASYLAPVVAVALGWAVLDERIGWLGLLGMLVVVCGVALAAGWGAPLVLSIRRHVHRASPE